MNPNAPSLDRADAFRVVDHLDTALNVVRQEMNATTLDIYIKSVLSTLKRQMLEHAMKSYSQGN
jgi:hypothetical protein